MGEFVLTVGGLSVRIRSSAQSLLDGLAARAHAFLVPNAQAQMDLSIEPDPTEPDCLEPIPRHDFVDGRLVFSLPGYRGHIDTGGGQLRFAGSNPVNAAEYFIRAAYALLAFQAGGLLVHAAAIVRNGRGYLFFGHSGAGKTTIARNSPQDLVLNDDLVLLLPGEAGWQVFGTPFTNPTQVKPSPAGAPAVALFRIVQSSKVAIQPLGRAAALAGLVASTPVLNNSPRPPLDRCREILEAVPAYELELLPDPSFWPHVEKI